MLTSSLTLLTGIVCLYIFGAFIVESLKKNTVFVFNIIPRFELTEANVYTLSLKLFLLVVTLLAPLVITIVLTSFLSRLLQDNGQLEFNLERITADFGKLSPIKGFGRLFNKDSLVEILKSLLKILIVGFIAYRILRDEAQNIALLADSDVEAITVYIGHVAFKIVIHSCGVLLVLGILDLLYVRWRYIENLKMTKQEVKEEHKDQEGNPEIKSKIKKLQFQMARRRMTKIIPTADVVITNPTHYAVALKYDRAKMIAPVVLAKGVDEMAQAIKKIAKESMVTLVENRFLARELYEQVDENEAIPESLYAAVAEVLAYVYKLKGKV